MAGFWRDFAGGFSQGSKDDNNPTNNQPNGGVGEEKDINKLRDDIGINNEGKSEIELKDIRIEYSNNSKEHKKNNTETVEDVLKAITEETLISEVTKTSNNEKITNYSKEKGQVEKEMELNNRTIITKSTIIAGNISTEDDLIIEGSVCGDVDCKGKLTISGEVSGNAIAKSISINTSKFEGDVRSDGRIEIKEGTVIIGNIYGDEALISGAVKGEIIVSNGARLEKTAIVKGNIRAKSVQIDNGAILQGFCELQYDNINLQDLFGEETIEEDDEVSPQSNDVMIDNMDIPEVEAITYEAVSQETEEVVEEIAEEEYEDEYPEYAEEEKEEEDEEVSLEETLERELEAEDAAREETVEDDEREIYMQEMEDNYSNFMDQLKIDAES